MKNLSKIQLLLILFILCFIGPTLVLLYDYLDVVLSYPNEQFPNENQLKAVAGHGKIISGLVIGLAIVIYAFANTFGKKS